jgi:hypothetical protein
MGVFAVEFCTFENLFNCLPVGLQLTEQILRLASGLKSNRAGMRAATHAFNRPDRKGVLLFKCLVP